MNLRHPAPKRVSELSNGTLPPSLALSAAPAIPLWHSFALRVSSKTFSFWDGCGIGFCILKDVPSGVNRKDRLNRHRGDAGNAPHKQRISPGEAHPFSKDGKCICSRNNSLIIGFLSYNQQMTRKTTSNIVRNSHSSVNSPFFPVAIFLVLWYCSVAERRRRYAERKQLYRRPVV